MKKKKSPKIPMAVSTEQIKALRRLAESGKLDEALRRLDTLKAQHPHFKPLYSLAWELASMADSPIQSIARAWDWTHASPNSERAWQALADGALSEGALALGMFANGRLQELAGETLVPHCQLDGSFGKLDFEVALANDTAHILTSSGRFDEALTVLEGFDHISSLNNRALIHFQQGDLRGALAGFEQSLRMEPHNIFALGYIFRLRLWLQGRDAAAELVEPLKGTTPIREEDALIKIDTLLMLQDWAGANEVWLELEDAHFLAESPIVNRLAATFHFVGGIAALRLGDLDAMDDRFELALNANPDLDELINHIALAAHTPDLTDMPDIMLSTLETWFTHKWLARLWKLKTETDETVERDYNSLLNDLDAHADYLVATAQWGGKTGRFLAIAILEQRAQSGDTLAFQALLELLTLPCGSDEVRQNLHISLIEDALLPAGGTVPMLIQDEVSDITHINIHADADPSELPSQSQARLEETFKLMHKHKHKPKDCIPILQELIDLHPDNPMLKGNLASIMEALNHPDSEVEALYQAAASLDPDYLFAITGLARLAAKRNEVNQAEEMIKPLLGRSSYHFTEWRAILMTQLLVAQQRNDLHTALNLIEQIEQLQNQFV